MTQKTFAVGEKLTSSNVNTYLNHTGGAFDVWTPVVTQSNAPALTNNSSTYWRAGRLVVADALVTIGGTGTASTVVWASLPVPYAPKYTSYPLIIGTGALFDASVPSEYPVVVYTNVGSSNTVSFKLASSSTGNSRLGTTTFVSALAAGDTIQFQVKYEAATG